MKVTFDKHRSLHPSLKSETDFDYSTVVEIREKKGPLHYKENWLGAMLDCVFQARVFCSLLLLMLFI